ncbi:hypothetical protein LDENG_00163990 [Lucifuga dentata]|nr:hypothetical protein LDENG_00163990 [Lucifuga dentata]
MNKNIDEEKKIHLLRGCHGEAWSCQLSWTGCVWRHGRTRTRAQKERGGHKLLTEVQADTGRVQERKQTRGSTDKPE